MTISQRCSGVPPTILIAVLSQLPKLKDLRLKGAPANSIPTILTHLLHLRSLDTEFPGAHTASRVRRSSNLLPPPPRPMLRSLTVRTSSMDSLGPHNFFAWIRELVPIPGLERFTLHAFTFRLAHTNIPRVFILDLARIHGDTLKHFIVGEAQLTLSDIECLCSKFPRLESLVCSVASPDIVSETIFRSGREIDPPARNRSKMRLPVLKIFRH